MFIMAETLSYRRALYIRAFAGIDFIQNKNRLGNQAVF